MLTGDFVSQVTAVVNETFCGVTGADKSERFDRAVQRVLTLRPGLSADQARQAVECMYRCRNENAIVGF